MQNHCSIFWHGLDLLFTAGESSETVATLNLGMKRTKKRARRIWRTLNRLENRKFAVELKQGPQWLSFTVGYLEVFKEEGSSPSDGMFPMHINVERQKGNRWSPCIAAQ